MAIIASPIPVLPEEFSTITSPGRSRPSSRAFSTMYRAIRSLTLPIGFMSSIFANAAQGRSTIDRSSSTSGVEPTDSEILRQAERSLTAPG